MRFFCDHDVDAEVASRLRKLGHHAWTAADAGLNRVSDDTLTVYACEKGAVLLTHDREFSQRRRLNVVGRHIWLQCAEWDAPQLLENHLAELAPQLESTSDLFVALSMAGAQTSRLWT